MNPRCALAFGLGALLVSGSVRAQQPETGLSVVHHPPPRPAPRRPARLRPAPAQPGTTTTPITAGGPRTLADALSVTYAYQPLLQSERAKLRATDENVPSALAGWRPTVITQGQLGYGDGISRAFNPLFSGWQKARTDRSLATAQATLTQPLYTGGKTQASVNQAKNKVMAERATLMAQEESSFLNAVTAYVGVIQSQQLLQLNINNEQVLAKQLQATQDRFKAGELTRTDVAQAEAALSGAAAQREIAEGNLATARASFQQVVGFYPATDLVEPQPLALPVSGEQQLAALAVANNPTVISALFNDSAARDQVDVAFAALLPQVSLVGQAFQQNNASARSTYDNGYQIGVQLSVPLYQGGAEYSAVRQAKQSQQQTQKLVADAQRTAAQQAVQAWDTLAAARASADSTRAQIRANQIALEGVEREAIVGSRTTLDVLNAQQALLTSETTLVQNLAQLVTASYQVASAIGRLTARDLHLAVPLYDETAYYNAVKNRWFGLGDYATHQPGR